MAIPFLTNIDLNQNELQNVVIQVLASDPSSPVEGQVWVNNASHRLKMFLNGVTVTLALLSDSLSVFAAPTGDLSIGSHKLTNVSDPTAAQDAATKAYVDAVAIGLNVKASCRFATAGALAAYTYNNGSSGVGATITENANGALSIDGSTPSVNDRVLVKDGTAGSDNGIYVVTQVGDASHPFILTRSTDLDTSAEYTTGSFTLIEDGTVNKGYAFIVNTQGTITIGTTSVTWGSSSVPGAASFALLTSGENNEAAMVVGHGASLTRDADGLIDASEIGGIKIPPGSAPTTVGKVPISQGDGTAAWADPLVQGAFAPGTNADTGNGGAPINPVLGGARRTTDAELQDLSCDAANNLNVNVQASALPAGASTAANQATAITALAGILAALGATLNMDVLSSVLPTNAAQESGGNLAAILNAINGSPTKESATGTGAAIVFLTVPANKQWALQVAQIEVVSDGTGSARTVGLTFEDPSFNIGTIYAIPTLALSSTGFFIFAPGIPTATTFNAQGVASVGFPTLKLGAGWKVGAFVAGGSSGDAVTITAAVVETSV